MYIRAQAKKSAQRDTQSWLNMEIFYSVMPFSDGYFVRAVDYNFLGNVWHGIHMSDVRNLHKK